VNPVELAVAFGAGVISITSPCCLPLLPGYLGYLTGLSSGDLEANRGRTLSAALLFALSRCFPPSWAPLSNEAEYGCR